MTAPALRAESDLAETGLEVRLACRNGCFAGPTAGMAPGYVQGNLAILPADLAADFLMFCEANPKPCPIIGMTAPGDPHIPSLGIDLDVRTDFPGYRIWENGNLIGEPTDIRTWWRDDLVTFVLGCSLSFEEALMADGLPLRHVDRRGAVPMYRTNVQCTPAGPFSGPLVVSMRPLSPAHAIRAVEITSRFPAVHGSPVHIGFPELIGIDNLSKPDSGDPVEILSGELPVFWACGVTPQAVLAAAKLPFAITHRPGSMLVTDIKNDQLAKS